VSAVPYKDDQKWQKHVKAELLLMPIELFALDGLLLLIYVRGNNISVVYIYNKGKTSVGPDFILQIMPHFT
jgi:hypothetical protein